MFKQCVAIILMSFSSILMVGHDIIPHHHNEGDDHHHVKHHNADSHHSHDSHTNQHHSDSNNSSNDEGSIGDLLSYFVHIGDFPIQESSLNHSIEIGNKIIYTPTLKFANYISLHPITDSKSKGYNYKGPVYIPPHSISKGLRAPPVFFS